MRGQTLLDLRAPNGSCEALPVRKNRNESDAPPMSSASGYQDVICERISEGESLRAICRDPGMPTEGAVRAWARDNRDGFGTKYRIARELQLDFWDDEIVAIADQERPDPRNRQVRIKIRK